MNTKSPIRCLIIEDEPIGQDILMEYTERIPSLQLVGTAANARQALEKCNQLIPELLLLDIQLPGLNGFEFLKILVQPVPLVVVTSAFPEYALQGYEYAVVDFLTKPIRFEKFNRAIQRVEQRLGHQRLDHMRQQESQGGGLKVHAKHLSVRIDRSLVKIPLQDINYFEALDNYVRIHLKSAPKGRAMLTKVTVTQLESILPSQDFIRINRKYIVPIDQIQLQATSHVKLFTGEELPIGITFRDTVRGALNPTQ